MRNTVWSLRIRGLLAGSLPRTRRHPDGARPSYFFPAACARRSRFLRLRHSAGELVDGAGLVLLCRLWDQLGLGRRLDEKGCGVPGVYRPSLLVEVWVALLFYGGRWLDDLRLLKLARCQAAVRLGTGAGSDDLRALSATCGRRAGAGAGRAPLARAPGALAGGGRAAARHAGAGLDRGGALRPEAGGSGEGLQSEEAGAAESGSPRAPPVGRGSPSARSSGAVLSGPTLANSLSRPTRSPGGLTC